MIFKKMEKRNDSFIEIKRKMQEKTKQYLIPQ